MPKEKNIWYYSQNGIQSGRAYKSFCHLLECAIRLAPSNVKFTSPDIEKLEKENEELKEKIGSLLTEMDTGHTKNSLTYSLK